MGGDGVAGAVADAALAAKLAPEEGAAQPVKASSVNTGRSAVSAQGRARARRAASLRDPAFQY